ncbi:hypothetical protein BVY00_01530 [bacterium G20]|nr:hypothetical protein BVY00_01530 [bacterium G20]
MIVTLMSSSNTDSKLAEKLSWLIGGILVLLPLHALFTTWAGSNFGHLDLWRVWKEFLLLLMVPAAVWLIWRTPQLKKWLFQSWIFRLFALYVLLHLILGVWAYVHHGVNKTALIYALIINLRFLGFFILCAIVGAHSTFLQRHWQKILLVPAGVVVVFGLLQKFILPYDFLRHFGYGKNTVPAYHAVDSNLTYRRIQSTLRGPNPLGAYLVLLIPAFLISLKRAWVRVLAFACALVVLFFSYSRSAEIGVAMALGLLAWWGIGKKISSRRIMALLVAVVVLVAGVLYASRNSQPVQDTLFHTSNSSAAPKSSNAVRLQSMKNSASDVVHQPLGRGPGTAGPASLRNNHTPRIAENYYLQIAQEVGVVGAALFVAINVLVAKELWARRNNQLAKVLLASLVGITFVNLLSHAWTDDTLSYLWWGLAGVALAPLLAKNKR